MLGCRSFQADMSEWMFFVISGYLITSIIVSEIDSKSFSLAIFYQRQIRRIFPALLLDRRAILSVLSIGPQYHL